MIKRTIVTGLRAITHLVSYAQERHQLIIALSPIVQVFGQASYDFENNNYG